MKTIEIVTLSKGSYVTARINGRATSRTWCKNKTEVTAKVKALKKEGYALA